MCQLQRLRYENAEVTEHVRARMHATMHEAFYYEQRRAASDFPVQHVDDVKHIPDWALALVVMMAGITLGMAVLSCVAIYSCLHLTAIRIKRVRDSVAQRRELLRDEEADSSNEVGVSEPSSKSSRKKASKRAAEVNQAEADEDL